MTVDEIIQRLGGVMKASRALQIDPASICRWKRPKERKGYGYIPSSYWDKILQLDSNITIEELYSLQKQAK